MSQLFIYWGHKLHVLGEPKLHNSALGAVLVWHAIVYVKEQFGRRREEGAVLRRPMNLPHYLQGKRMQPSCLQAMLVMSYQCFILLSSVGSNGVFVCK